MSTIPAAGPNETPQQFEDEVLRRLAEEGLVVPTRDPHRPHTKTEERCWKIGVAGVARKGGMAFNGRHPCKRPGCEGCATRWADRQLSGLLRAYGGFVGLEHVYREPLLLYTPKSDKVPDHCLWVPTVPMPPPTPGQLKGRLNTRARRSSTPATLMVIPCDGLGVVVSTADMSQSQGQGRPVEQPTFGFFLPVAVAFVYLRAVLSSRAVCGRLDWPTAWKPEEPTTSSAYTITGDPIVTDTVWRILTSNGYRWDPGQSWWDREDPMDVLYTAKRQAEAFWANPLCEACGGTITPRTQHWEDGHPFCPACGLAYDLIVFMVKGRTEREIEAHLQVRKLTFRRKRPLIEEALRRAAARKAANGIWVPKSTEEGAA